jgi:xanthine dehydrogenase accessory factor
MGWIEAIAALSSEDKGFVIVTILSVEGSAPRDAEAKMVVDDDKIYDTIGGGNLEYQAIDRARKMLRAGRHAIVRESFTLGSDLTQCCGGKVELLFECLPATNFNIVLFGAGHVGRALITILSELPCRVTCIDPRESFITALRDQVSGSNIDLVKMQNPEIDVEKCPENAFYLIMTHSHELDVQLVEAILSRNDFRFCGLIGSKSKAAKFRSRLKRKQFRKEEINRLTSPVGMDNIPGKRPMEVAVSIAGQLIAMQHTLSQEKSQEHNPDKRDSTAIKSLTSNIVDIRD